MADQRKRLEKRLDKERVTRANRERRRQDSLYLNDERSDEQMQKLMSDVDDIQFDMVSFTNKGQAWIDIQDKGERTNHQRMMGEIMQRRMLYACAQQLRGGLSAGKVLSAIGMYAGMAALNPAFRDMVTNMKAQGIGTALNLMADHPDKKFLGRNLLTNTLTKKRDKYLAAANQGRMPFTPETAAVADIRMAKEAYAQMRDGKHDPAEVMDRYNEAHSTLDSLMKADGVSREDMARSQRIIIGKAVERDPSYRDMFREMGYGTWVQAEPTEERVPVYDENNIPHMETMHVWRGEYETYDENGASVPVDSTATFTVREPMTDMEYAKGVMQVMDEHDNAFDLANPDELHTAREDMTRVMHRVNGDKTATCASQNPDDQMAFAKACADMSAYRDMAMTDWQNTSGAEGVKARERRVATMGLNGAIAKQASVLLYADSYSDTATPFDSVDGQHAADISSLAVAFAERTAGVDTSSEAFGKHIADLGSKYALASACVDAGIDMDLTNPKNCKAVKEFIESSPENQQHYDDMARTACGVMHTYASNVTNMMAMGASKDEAMEMLRYSEDEGAKIWYEGDGETIDANVRGLYEARAWADKQVGNLDTSDLDTSYAKSCYQQQEWRTAQSSNAERAAQRARQAESKFGGLGNDGYDDGPQYN